MTILHSGTTKKYSTNWARAFGETPKKSPSAKKKAQAPKAAAKRRASSKKK